MNMFLMNLSTASLLYTVFDSIFTLWTKIEPADIPIYKHIRETGWLMLFTPMYLSYIMLTLDRVFMIHLNLRYGLYVTKSKAIKINFFIWMIGLSHVLHYWFPSTCFVHRYFLPWDIAVLITFITSYSYILIKTKKQQQKLTIHSKRTLKYKVPFLVVLTMFVGWFIPDLMLVSKVIENSIWVSIWWSSNLLSDPLIYIFCTPRISKRIKGIWHEKQSTLKKSQLSTIHLQSISNRIKTLSGIDSVYIENPGPD